MHMRRTSGTSSHATEQVGTRSRSIRGRTSAGDVRCSASDGRSTPARPASHVWNASVDVRRRTRRNVYTIRGAAPELNHRTSCRGLRGSASWSASLPSPNLIVKPRGLFAETQSIRARSCPNPKLTCSTNRYLGQQCKKSLKISYRFRLAATPVRA